MGRNNTIYNSLNDHSLYSLFSSRNWNNLSNNQKLDACQEIENRLAAERGTEPREVLVADMNDGCYGYQYKDTITLNSNVVNDGVFRVTGTDLNGNTQTRFVDVNAASWEIFDTIHHEDLHGYWEDAGIMPDTEFRVVKKQLLKRAKTKPSPSSKNLKKSLICRILKPLFT